MCVPMMQQFIGYMFSKVQWEIHSLPLRHILWDNLRTMFQTFFSSTLLPVVSIMSDCFSLFFSSNFSGLCASAK